MTDQTIKPDIRIVPIDETEFWSDEYQQTAGKVVNLYLFDASIATHLCSFEKSFWLVHFGFFTQNELNDDQYDEFHYELNREDQSDYYSKSILGAKHIKVTEWDDSFPGYDDQEDYNEWFNDILEYFQGNSIECEAAALLGIDFEEMA